MKARGFGRVYQPTYEDKRTGERKTAGTWWLQYNHRGRTFRESSGSPHRVEAVRLLKKRLGAMGAGKPVGPSVEKTNFEDLVAMLRDDYRANGRRSLERVETAVGHLAEVFASSRVVDLTADRITAYVAGRREAGAAPASVNRELSALKRMFRLGQRAGKVGDRPYIAMLAENNVRKGFFETEQWEAVRRHLPEDLKPVFETAYVTGWRVTSEILTRQRSHLDLTAGWLRLEPGEDKNKAGRMFPLTPGLRAVLDAQGVRTRALEVATGRVIQWLFHRGGEPIKSFRRAWVTACKRAGLPGRIPHDFRRTAVRNLERAGVPRSAAMAMVGHRTMAVYSRYAIADEGMLRDGAAKLAALHEREANTAPTVVPLRAVAPGSRG